MQPITGKGNPSLCGSLTTPRLPTNISRMGVMSPGDLNCASCALPIFRPILDISFLPKQIIKMHAIAEIGNNHDIQHGSTVGPARYDLQIKAQIDHGSYISANGLPAQNVSLLQINHGHSTDFSTHIEPQRVNFERLKRPSTGETKIDSFPPPDQPKLIYSKQGGKGILGEWQTLKETLTSLENSVKHASLSHSRSNQLLVTLEDLKIEALQHKGDRERLAIILAEVRIIELEFKPPLNTGPGTGVEKSPGHLEIPKLAADTTCLIPTSNKKYINDDGSFKVKVGQIFDDGIWSSIDAKACFKIFDNSKLFVWKSWDEAYAGLHLFVNGKELTDKTIWVPVTQLQLTADQINLVISAGKTAIKYQIETLKDDHGAYTFADWMIANLKISGDSTDLVAQSLTGKTINPNLNIESTAKNDTNNIFHYLSFKQNPPNPAEVQMFDQKIGDSVWLGHIANIGSTFFYPDENTVWFSSSGYFIYLRLRAQDGNSYWARFDQLSLNQDQKVQVVRAAKNIVKDMILKNKDISGALAIAQILKDNLNLSEPAEVIVEAALKSAAYELQKPDPPTPILPTDTPSPTATRTLRPTNTLPPPKDIPGPTDTPQKIIVSPLAVNTQPAGNVAPTTTNTPQPVVRQPEVPSLLRASPAGPNQATGGLSGKEAPIDPGNLFTGAALVAGGVGLGYYLLYRRTRNTPPVQNQFAVPLGRRDQEPPDGQPGADIIRGAVHTIPLPRVLKDRPANPPTEKFTKKKKVEPALPTTVVKKW